MPVRRTASTLHAELSRRAVLRGLAGGAAGALLTGSSAWAAQSASQIPATPCAPCGASSRVVVVGAGVIGLSSAILLQEAGFDVEIWAAELTPGTTSDRAAAFWYPFHVLPLDEAAVWGEASFKMLSSLAGEPGTGVEMEPTTIVFEDDTDDPPWARYIPDFSRPTADELPTDYVTAYRFTTPVAEMPVYMAYLMDRFQQGGGIVVQRMLISLEEALAETSLVVNATGLGSRSLIGDDRLFPIRGQLVRIARPEATDPYVLLGEGPTTGLVYVVYRPDDVILGGTAEDGNWSLVPDPGETEGIIERAIRVAPEVAGAEVLGEIVGLRPGRDAERLEAEPWGDGTVVHCYGHGGGGVSLSWGCAEDVVQLVMANA